MQTQKITKAFTHVKPEASRVFIPLEIETAAYNKIAKNIDILEQAANKVNKDIIFAPKGENVLMNFGPHTTMLDVQLRDSAILKQMNDLIRKTYTTVK